MHGAERGPQVGLGRVERSDPRVLLAQLGRRSFPACRRYGVQFIGRFGLVGGNGLRRWFL